MKVALTHSLNSLPIIYALEKGIFRDYGLDVQIFLYSSLGEIERRLELGFEECGEVSLSAFLKQNFNPEVNLSFYPLAPLSFTQCKFYSDNPIFANTNLQLYKNYNYYTILPKQDSIQNYIFNKIAKQLFSENLSIAKNTISLNLADKFFYTRECLGMVGDPLTYPFLYEVKNIFQIYEDVWLPNTVLCFQNETIKLSPERIRFFLQALQDSISHLRNATLEDIFHNVLTFFTKFYVQISLYEIQASINYAKKFLENIFPLYLDINKEDIFLEILKNNDSTNTYRFKEILSQIRNNIQAIKSLRPIRIEPEFNSNLTRMSKIRYQKIDAEMYRILFREAIEIMMLVSEDFQILDVNNKFIQETELSFEDVVDKNLNIIFPKGNDFDLIKSTLSNKNENIHIASLSLVCNKHLTFNVDIHIMPFKRHEHKDYLFTIINNTEKKEIIRLKNEFISNISHELRTPMTNIQGYFEMLLLDPQIKLSSEARNNLDAIGRNIKKMNKLIENLLQLGKNKSEKQPQLIEIFEPHTIIEEVIYINETLAKEKKLEIRKNLQGDIFIKGNKFEFSQVITNLVVNAIKYTDYGYISVSCHKTQDGYCEIKVKDTGIGIDPKYHSAIFERFFRVPDFQNRKVGGTGIGLAISKEIIEKMGGSIKLESELGKGSEFKILIPSAV